MLLYNVLKVIYIQKENNLITSTGTFKESSHIFLARTIIPFRYANKVIRLVNPFTMYTNPFKARTS